MSEIKKSKLRIFADGVKAYWGYGATLFAIGAVVYAQGVKSQSGKGNVELLKNQTEMKYDIKVIKDSITAISEPMRKEVRNLSDALKQSKDAYNGLRSVVLDHISKPPTDPPLTLEEFKRYMENAPVLEKNLYFYVPQIGVEKITHKIN
jgi:hypothetical protein